MVSCEWCGKQITGKVYHYDTKSGSRLKFHRNCREYYIENLRKKQSKFKKAKKTRDSPYKFKKATKVGESEFKFKKAKNTGEAQHKFKKAVKVEEPKKFGTKDKGSDTSVGKLLKKIRGL